MPILDPVTPQIHLGAFKGYGIELEYMIVDCETLAARSLADRLLVDAAGQIVNEVEHGELAWSNELVAHVIELKTNGPADGLGGLAKYFHADVLAINQALFEYGACLLPTAMHPLFDPLAETVLWPYGQNDIYAAYDRIFGCKGHGWSNLQSMHINLPFANDEEFVRLHAAIRVVLPLIPALSASSPLEQGRRSAWLDNRLRYYRDNQRRIPTISGQVIPEPVSSINDYHRRVLAPMYQAIAPHDPDHILADDWLNSRAAIARFERQTIEIRIIDLQECPAADLAIAELVVALVRAFYDEALASTAAQQALETSTLADCLFLAAEKGSKAMVQPADYLKLLGVDRPMAAGQVWQVLLDRLPDISPGARTTLDVLLKRGTLAEAIMAELGQQPSPESIRQCYRKLAQCLQDNHLFRF